MRLHTDSTHLPAQAPWALVVFASLSRSLSLSAWPSVSLSLSLSLFLSLSFSFSLSETRLSGRGSGQRRACGCELSASPSWSVPLTTPSALHESASHTDPGLELNFSPFFPLSLSLSLSF